MELDKCVLCQIEVDYKLDLLNLLQWKKLHKDKICSQCRQNFKNIEVTNTCKGCNSFKSKDLCDDCLYWQEKYPMISTNHRALYHYNDFAHDWVALYKVKGHTILADVFSNDIKTIIKNEFKNRIIVPIPSSESSLQNRKFKQVETILQYSQISFEKLLIDHSKGEKQSRKNKHERLQTKQTFTINKAIYNGLSTNKLLLFDDIYTTGSTIIRAKSLLQENGFTDVKSLSLFR